MRGLIIIKIICEQSGKQNNAQIGSTHSPSIYKKKIEIINVSVYACTCLLISMLMGSIE